MDAAIVLGTVGSGWAESLPTRPASADNVFGGIYTLTPGSPGAILGTAISRGVDSPSRVPAQGIELGKANLMHAPIGEDNVDFAGVARVGQEPFWAS